MQLQGTVLDEWITTFAKKTSHAVAALSAEDIQAAIKDTGNGASIFAIRQSQALLNGSAAPRPAIAQAGNGIVRDVVMAPPLAPGVRSALWGLEAIRSAATLTRGRFFERTAQGIADYAAYARARYGDEQGPRILADLVALNQLYTGKMEGDFRQLMIDPGVVSKTHRAAFRSFATRNAATLLGSSAFDIRRAYAESCGEKTYYRALKLSAGALEAIMGGVGMANRASRALARYPDLERRIRAEDPTILDPRELVDRPIGQVIDYHVRPFSRSSTMRAWTTMKPDQKKPYVARAAQALGLDPAVKKNLAQINKKAEADYVEARNKDLDRLKDGDSFLSVTEDLRVALSVAADPAMAGKMAVGEAIYLFQLALSPADVIDPADYVGVAQSPSRVKFGDGPWEVYSARIEGIVVGHIRASEIVNVEQLDLSKCTAYKMQLDWQ